MHLAERRFQPDVTGIDARLATLRRATARREKLEALFADADFLNRTIADGRYLRLCGAIAWASEREEQARTAVETDEMVGMLRDSAASRPARG